MALIGYHRKSAIRLIQSGRKPKHLDRRGRLRIHTPDVKAALLEIREACGCICSKRLAPFLPEIVAVPKQKRVLASPVAPKEAKEILRGDLPNVEPPGTTGLHGAESGRVKGASWVTGIIRQACRLR